MAKSLVVVESPAKAKTINKYLGRNYKVVASMGHVRDLPKSKLGVDIEENFEPSYEVIASRKKCHEGAEGRRQGRRADLRGHRPRPRRGGHRLAPGRGAGHRQPEEDPPADVQRDHEEGVLSALEHPGDIDKQMVDAQQARRVLDRLVGYKISPLLWDKVRRGLSAGRVQSVALKLVCDREREIEALRLRGVLAHHGPARRGRTARVRRAAAQGRRRSGQDRQPGGGRCGSPTSSAPSGPSRR
jgi:DNA topoisomerase I